MTWDQTKIDLKEAIISQPPFTFKVLKNIAKDIEGFFFLHKKRYRLLFGNEISKFSETKNESMNVIFLPIWGWMEPNTIIYGIYDSENWEPTEEEDGLLLIYRDIEGNQYYTRENEKYSQRSSKGRSIFQER